MSPPVPSPLANFALEVRKELMRFFKRRVNCPETAADLTQETFLRLHDGGRYASTDNLRAVAFHIASNLAIDHSRRTHVRAAYASELGEQTGIEDLPCPKAGPEREVAARQSVECINRAFSELSEIERTILYLSVVDELTYAQISKITATPLRTVAKRLAQALKHCRASLER